MAPSSLQVERLVQAAQPKVFSRMGFITQSVPRGSAPPAVGALGSRKGEHERVCDQGPVSGPNKKMKGLTREEKFEHVSAEIIARGGLRRTLMFNGEGETVVARDEVFFRSQVGDVRHARAVRRVEPLLHRVRGVVRRVDLPLHRVWVQRHALLLLDEPQKKRVARRVFRPRATRRVEPLLHQERVHRRARMPR